MRHCGKKKRRIQKPYIHHEFLGADLIIYKPHSCNKVGDERTQHAIHAIDSDLVTQAFASFEDTALLTGKYMRQICATKEIYSSILHFIELVCETGISLLDSSVLVLFLNYSVILSYTEPFSLPPTFMYM